MRNFQHSRLLPRTDQIFHDQVSAREEVAFVDLTVLGEVVHGDLHQLDHFVWIDIFIGTELAGGAFEDVDIGVGDRVEATALDEDGAFAQGG